MQVGKFKEESKMFLSEEQKFFQKARFLFGLVTEKTFSNKNISIFCYHVLKHDNTDLIRRYF